jgi:hypothetical protein
MIPQDEVTFTSKDAVSYCLQALQHTLALAIVMSKLMFESGDSRNDLYGVPYFRYSNRKAS